MPRHLMCRDSPATVTRLLHALDAGDRTALERLLPIIYSELRELAHRQRRRWRGNPTMNTTALVHELYLRLADQEGLNVESRAHFYALASQAMRQILSNYSRARRARKRGGDAVKLPLEEAALVPDEDSDFSDDDARLLAALDDALKRLERIDERRSLVVECRFYGGMSISDTATALGISPTTVKRDWTAAQAWLHRELEDRL